MCAESGFQQDREKNLNLLKWVALVGDLSIATLLVIFFSSLGTQIYVMVFILLVLGAVDFFVLFPWLVRRGRQKST